MQEVVCREHGRLRGRHRSPHYGASRVSPSNVCLARSEQTRGATVLTEWTKRPYDKRGLEDWAELGNASSRTLARLFRAETGLSFRQWRQQARLTEALSDIDGRDNGNAGS
ncbi:helix-turn-helix domain-containing protein [Rhizobium ruizarguesonis]